MNKKIILIFLSLSLTSCFAINATMDVAMAPFEAMVKADRAADRAAAAYPDRSPRYLCAPGQYPPCGPSPSSILSTTAVTQQSSTSSSSGSNEPSGQYTAGSNTTSNSNKPRVENYRTTIEGDTGWHYASENAARSAGMENARSDLRSKCEQKDWLTFYPQASGNSEDTVYETSTLNVNIARQDLNRVVSYKGTYTASGYCGNPFGG